MGGVFRLEIDHMQQRSPYHYGHIPVFHLLFEVTAFLYIDPDQIFHVFGCGICVTVPPEYILIEDFIAKRPLPISICKTCSQCMGLDDLKIETLAQSTTKTYLEERKSIRTPKVNSLALPIHFGCCYSRTVLGVYLSSSRNMFCSFRDSREK